MNLLTLACNSETPCCRAKQITAHIEGSILVNPVHSLAIKGRMVWVNVRVSVIYCWLQPSRTPRALDLLFSGFISSKYAAGLMVLSVSSERWGIIYGCLCLGTCTNNAPQIQKDIKPMMTPYPPQLMKWGVFLGSNWSIDGAQSHWLIELGDKIHGPSRAAGVCIGCFTHYHDYGCHYFPGT